MSYLPGDDAAAGADRRCAVSTYRIGAPYNPRVRQWPETLSYQYRAGAHELLLFFASPSKTEIDAVGEGKAHIALHVEPPVIILCARFEPLPWSDASYSWHLVPEVERDLPSADLSADHQAVLTTILVDANTGIVRAIRVVTLGSEFTRALHSAIRAQAASPWNAHAYDAALDRLTRSRSSDELAEGARFQTVGGA